MRCPLCYWLVRVPAWGRLAMRDAFAFARLREVDELVRRTCRATRLLGNQLVQR